MNSLRKFTVYQKAIKFLTLSHELIENLPRGNSILSDQLKRSSLSIPLNIAEGAGKTSSRDKRRFYSIARGSALESLAAIDACRVMGLSEERELSEAQGILEEVIAMLTVLTGWKG